MSRFSFGQVHVFHHDLNIDFMKWKWVSIGISLVLSAISLVAIFGKGINYSIDFLGGAEISLTFSKGAVTRSIVDEAINSWGVHGAEVVTVGRIGTASDSFLVRLPRLKGEAQEAIGQKADQFVARALKTWSNQGVAVGSVTNISGKIGDEEQTKGYVALLISFVGILIYTAYRFDARFAPGAVLCLVHDVLIALGVMTLLGRPFSVSSIAAFLTIVGYSCNDTIIVYDRIRETQLKEPRLSLVDVVNRSINQTMNRTVLTSSTGLLALLVLVLFGGGAIEDFALTMFIGILVGTYSSIYVAAPLTLVMDDFLRKRGWHLKTQNLAAKPQKDPNYIPPVVLRKKP